MTLFVLHSPYPDHSWRGIEKCLDSPDGGILFFRSYEEAEEYLKELGKEPCWWIVPLEVEIPDIREKLFSGSKKPA